MNKGVKTCGPRSSGFPCPVHLKATLSWCSSFPSWTFKDTCTKEAGSRECGVWETLSREETAAVKTNEEPEGLINHFFFLCSTHTHFEQQWQPLPSRKPHASSEEEDEWDVCLICQSVHCGRSQALTLAGLEVPRSVGHFPRGAHCFG